jgi:hypothetical protein
VYANNINLDKMAMHSIQFMVLTLFSRYRCTLILTLSLFVDTAIATAAATAAAISVDVAVAVVLERITDCENPVETIEFILMYSTVEMICFVNLH